MVESVSPLTFFEVFDLCKCLDAERTNSLAIRMTKVYFCKDRPCFKVIHVENGITTTGATEFVESDDIELELLSLHAIVDDKVRAAKVVYDDDWIYPVPF